MEFRTDVPGEEKGEDSGGSNDYVDTLLTQAKKELAKSPEKRVAFANGLYENYGVDPSITALFIPGLENDLEKMQENAQEDTTEGQQPKMDDEVSTNQLQSKRNEGNATVRNTQTEEKGKPMPEVDNKLTPEDILKVVQGMIETLGEDTTLGELETLVEANPDIVEREIDEYL